MTQSLNFVQNVIVVTLKCYCCFKNQSQWNHNQNYWWRL